MKNDASKRLCVVLGGGGHARVVIDAAQDSGDYQLHSVLDPNSALWGTTVLDVPVLGDESLLPNVIAKGVEWFVVAVGSVGDNRVREQIFQRARSVGMKPLSVIHRSSVISRHAIVGEGCQILATAVINANAELGMNVIVNTGAIVEHDCRIGDHAHIAPGACLAANVHVGRRAHIGLGASVRQGSTIGDDAVVGAGAVVVRDIPSGQIVAGVPARSLAEVRR